MELKDWNFDEPPYAHKKMKRFQIKRNRNILGKYHGQMEDQQSLESRLWRIVQN